MTISRGDIFYNPKRGNCLRVIREYPCHFQGVGYPPEGKTEQVVACMSFRHDGSKGSQPQSIRRDKLIENYLKVKSIVLTLEDSR